MNETAPRGVAVRTAIVRSYLRACLKKPLAVGRGVPAEPSWAGFAPRRLIGTIRPTIFRQALRATATRTALFCAILLGASRTFGDETHHEKPPPNPPVETSRASTLARSEAESFGHRTGASKSSGNLFTSLLDAAPSSKTELKARLEVARALREAERFDEAERELVGLVNLETLEDVNREAILELAILFQDRRQLARAQKLYARYLKEFPEDSKVPEVYLRQGLLYREMGANSLAIAKYYAVLSMALRLKEGSEGYYRGLVLQAQSEIADTYYLMGKYEDAAEFLTRLLKLNDDTLNRRHIIFKLVRSLAYTERYPEIVAYARTYVEQYPGGSELPEVRFLLANTLKKLGQNRESLQEVLVLLKSEQAKASDNPRNWIYWQQRTGNEIANQLYQEGDYLSALEIYKSLAPLNSSPSWQLPVWYQMGLVYERLQQPDMASEMYVRILASAEKKDAEEPSPNLGTVLDMARWRKNYLQWQNQAETENNRLSARSPPPE